MSPGDDVLVEGTVEKRPTWAVVASPPLNEVLASWFRPRATRLASQRASLAGIDSVVGASSPAELLPATPSWFPHYLVGTASTSEALAGLVERVRHIGWHAQVVRMDRAAQRWWARQRPGPSLWSKLALAFLICFAFASAVTTSFGLLVGFPAGPLTPLTFFAAWIGATRLFLPMPLILLRESRDGTTT